MDILDSATLLEVLRVQKTPKLFFLNKFYTRQINFPTGAILFDKVSEDFRQVAPFVAPNVKGRVMKRAGHETLAFRPAYLKPKGEIDLEAPFARQAGEALGTGSMSPEQRHSVIVAETLAQQKAAIEMRWEWMAVRAAVDGSVVVQGEDYPAVTVDFRRDAGLTTTLTSGARWNQAGTSFPLTDIQTKRTLVNTLTGGVVRDLYFGSAAWASFRNHATVTPLMDTQYRGSVSNLTALIDGFEDSIEALGSIEGANGAGLIRMWLYSAKYKDDTGTLQDMFPTNAVWGVADQTMAGTRCFGAIKDGKAGFQPLPIFSKNWEEEDPWVEWLLSQSAPLMVPGQPNATFKLIVQ